MSALKHALIVPLYGDLHPDSLNRFKRWIQHGFFVVLVDNNPIGSLLNDVELAAVVPHHNRLGLAGGFNDGVAFALANGADCITLLDQDSLISTTSLLKLGHSCSPGLVVGPRIIDLERGSEHAPAKNRVRILISSGTTFLPSTWTKVGPYLGWMEIDYIDHEWCSRARSVGFDLEVLDEAVLFQTFGSRHPNHIAHLLGLQLYSPYRRAIALRNLKWLLLQRYIPMDIRLKELIKMLLKPWIWLIFEPERRRCLAVLRLGLSAPFNMPFPRNRLEKF